MSLNTQARLPRSRTTLLCVVAVVVWTAANVIASFALAASHEVMVVTVPTAADRFLSVMVAVVTALAYILVVRRAPSVWRWIWCMMMVVAMIFAIFSSLGQSETGVHAYSFHEAIIALLAGLIIAWPLLRFYNRPAKHS